jgi:hypothetical protein
VEEWRVEVGAPAERARVAAIDQTMETFRHLAAVPVLVRELARVADLPAAAHVPVDAPARADVPAAA